MAVPLPFLIVALFGGAISLSRRVPEIPRRYDPGYVDGPGARAIDATKAREQLACQILLFMSAPMIAMEDTRKYPIVLL